MSGKIVTTCVFPPIPDRRWDWIAYYEGREEDGRYGYGATEAEAIADFIENYADEAPDVNTVTTEKAA